MNSKDYMDLVLQELDGNGLNAVDKFRVLRNAMEEICPQLRKWYSDVFYKTFEAIDNDVQNKKWNFPIELEIKQNISRPQEEYSWHDVYLSLTVLDIYVGLYIGILAYDNLFTAFDYDGLLMKDDINQDIKVEIFVEVLEPDSSPLDKLLYDCVVKQLEKTPGCVKGVDFDPVYYSRDNGEYLIPISCLESTIRRIFDSLQDIANQETTKKQDNNAKDQGSFQ